MIGCCGLTEYETEKAPHYGAEIVHVLGIVQGQCCAGRLWKSAVFYCVLERLISKYEVLCALGLPLMRWLVTGCAIVVCRSSVHICSAAAQQEPYVSKPSISVRKLGAIYKAWT